MTWSRQWLKNCGGILHYTSLFLHFTRTLQPEKGHVYSFATVRVFGRDERNAGALMPDLGFLFGADRQEKSINGSRAAGGTDLTFHRCVQAHPRSQQHSDPTSTSLDLALQTSARSGLDSYRSSSLIESLPISFAPAMSAPPGGYSYVALLTIVSY